MSSFALTVKNKNITLQYKGDPALFNLPKISIVGTRNPNQYTQEFTAKIAASFSKKGIITVSGGAIGVDTLVHKNSNSNKTICVLPCGINHLYPAINKQYFHQIEKQGLLVSQFDDNFKPTNWSFVQRNEIVVALGEALIITQADLKSGSMKSAEFAIAQNKKIFVLPHRCEESQGTNFLLEQNLATPIYNIETLITSIFDDYTSLFSSHDNDPFLDFCRQNPNYEDVFLFDNAKLFEYELAGKIKIVNQKITII